MKGGALVNLAIVGCAVILHFSSWSIVHGVMGGGTPGKRGAISVFSWYQPVPVDIVTNFRGN